MRVELGEGKLMRPLTDEFPVSSGVPGSLEGVIQGPCRGRIGNEAGGGLVNPFQVSPDIRHD